jgi:hypothetical protein
MACFLDHGFNAISAQGRYARCQDENETFQTRVDLVELELERGIIFLISILSLRTRITAFRRLPFHRSVAAEDVPFRVQNHSQSVRVPVAAAVKGTPAETSQLPRHRSENGFAWNSAQISDKSETTTEGNSDGRERVDAGTGGAAFEGTDARLRTRI